MSTPMTEASKKHYVYKRDKARHHQLMARESDPYRGQSTTTVDDEDVKPVSRPKYDPDRPPDVSVISTRWLPSNTTSPVRRSWLRSRSIRSPMTK